MGRWGRRSLALNKGSATISISSGMETSSWSLPSLKNANKTGAAYVHIYICMTNEPEELITAARGSAAAPLPPPELTFGPHIH